MSVQTPSSQLLPASNPDKEEEYDSDKRKVVFKFIGFFTFIVVMVFVCIYWAASVSGDNSTSAVVEDENLYINWVEDSSLVCMDGSPAAYYTRIPNINNKWMIFFEYGGSYCWDQETCDSRASSDEEYTTSTMLEDTKVETGLLSTDPIENPYLHNWNIITVSYCSSDYWSGASTPDTSGTDYYFQGANIARGVIAEVIANGLLDDAETILLGGQGAGGYGVLINGDELYEDLAATGAEVKGFLDTAWSAYSEERWDDPPTCTTASNCPVSIGIESAIDTWQPLLPERCTSQGLTWECYLPGISNIGEIVMPLFAFQWQYEIAQLSSEGITVLDYDDEEMVAYAQMLADVRKDEFELLPEGSGWHNPQCYDHEIYTKDYVTVRGILEDLSVADALNDFVSGTVHRFGEDCGDVDCNPTCGAELYTSTTSTTE